MYTIGIYPRKSVYRDNSDSVQVQVQLCKDYAGIIFKDKEIEFKIYDKDEGYSGKNMNRPSFIELMQDVKSNQLNAVIVYKLDRISRNVQEFSAMYEVFQKHDVSFISVKESFDTTTPMGRTVMYILAAFAQLERENTSERVTDSMQTLGAAGKWTGGKLPSGMTSVRRKIDGKEHSYLIVDNETINRVKLLYELILKGYTITKVERHCRDNAIRSQSGKFLNTSQIYNILTNPVYCQNSIESYYYFKDAGCIVPDQLLFDGKKGLIGYGKTKAKDSSHKKNEKKDWIIATGIHEPVISAIDWIAVQKRLGINKTVRTRKHEIGILKGIIRCGRCGARIDIRNYTKNNIMFSYYYCSDMARQGKEKCDTGYTRVEEVDKAFLSQLQNVRLNPSYIQLREETTGTLKSTSALRSELQRIQTSIDNLTTALMQAMETSASGYIIKQISTLDKEKSVLESNLRKSELFEVSAKSVLETEKEIYDNICYLLDDFDYISYTAKNELLRKIIKNCTFDGKNLRIIF